MFAILPAFLFAFTHRFLVVNVYAQIFTQAPSLSLLSRLMPVYLFIYFS